jgi:hypothetical protein
LEIVLTDVQKGFQFLEVSQDDPQVCDRGRRWYKGVEEWKVLISGWKQTVEDVKRDRKEPIYLPGGSPNE